MPTPHPHLELARRTLPLAAHIRENDSDGTLAEVAVKGLAETFGIDIVVVDPDPVEKLADLGQALHLQLRDLLHRHGTRQAAMLAGVQVTDGVLALLKGAAGQQGRQWRRQRVRRLQVGGR